MIIHQFYDKGLAHASYAVIRNAKMIVIDPSRDPQPYYDFARLHEADITGVIETHPHADFVSSHLEIHQTTGAVIYTSKLAGAIYPHEGFDDGDIIYLADIKLRAINTPGHSPDSICILLQDENGYDKALFTGDTLFVGDVGRPDLRENAGNITAKKEELAKQLYHSLREKIMVLPHHLIAYPAHGPGSLCGKTTSPDLYSNIGRELKENYALQEMSEQAFVEMIIADQPFVPHYFGFDVDLNKKGAPAFQQSINVVLKADRAIEKNIPVIDTRQKEEFRQGHIKGAINLQNGEKFETWLGSIIQPDEPFYLIAATSENLDTVIKKAAKIGYEQNIKAALISTGGKEQSATINIDDFKTSPERYTVVDVRNWNEINDGKIFNHALTIPLPELRERLEEIPTDKPIAVHCAGGYRSAAATSIVAGKINTVAIYDLGETITQFEAILK
ncbi:rhodanese-like domain-containing protein [Mucilaginibacter sp.]|uniref:MBL fold metallo-hydrolase n=1 Tax=Mucilaginibacter sp. TaxID=1882438 RepID=UPI0026121BA4|nr:rhodanese-like domain-containing protein [Mucilaginibacter sp.]MDB5029611.1 fold metallo-hydrolase [Mucilaginibacter sp.]